MLCYFLLGSTPLLSLAELKAVYLGQSFLEISSNLFLSDFPSNFDPPIEMKKLGGTVKIGKIICVLKDKNLLKNKIIQILRGFAKDQKINYGISRYGNSPIGHIRAFPKEIKSELEKINLKSRFILPSEGEALTSVQIVKYKLQDIIVAKKDNEIYLGQTLAVQDFSDWGKRDYKRPFADPKSGMLPPKIARIMVNIALKNSQLSPVLSEAEGTLNSQFVILDPFCGMGTIGAESLMRGCWTIISDIEKKTLEKADKNLEWLCAAYDLKKDNYSAYVSDAKNIGSKLGKVKIDAIVTEPYLGPPINYYKGKPMINDRPITEGRILHVFLELEELYASCFSEWKNILKPGGLVVMVIPSFRIGENDYCMKNLIDSCEKLGYNVADGPYEYGHPQSILRRSIYIFQKR